MTSLTADHGRFGRQRASGPPVGYALGAFAVTTLGLAGLVVGDATGRVDATGGPASQFGVVAMTTFLIAGAAASYRALAVRNLWAAALAGLLLGASVWAWIVLVEADPSDGRGNAMVALGANCLAVVLLIRGVRRRRWLEVFGGLGALVVGLVASFVRFSPSTAEAGPTSLLAAVAGLICLYGLLADLEVSEHRSLNELSESRRRIEAEVIRVEDLLHDLRSGLLAIETAIGGFDDDLAVPLRAEAARLRRMTLSGDRRVDRFDLARAVANLVATRRATGSDIDLRIPGRVVAWGEESEVVAIVENLLTNAERHGRPGTTVVSVAADDTTVRLAVTSPGELAGDDPEEVFRRGVTSHPDGRGLGLARSRMLAGINGADLTLGPAPAGHTTFVLGLRARPPMAA